MAEALRMVAGLYKDGLPAKPTGHAHQFTDLLTFHATPAPIEQTLLAMRLEPHMRAFQGSSRATPNYALSCSWSETKGGSVGDTGERRADAEEPRIEEV